MIDILSSKQITFKTINVSGGPITSTEWKIDDVIQENNTTDTLIIQPNQLTIDEHTIKFRSQNYCGNYSNEKIETLNIIEESNMAYNQDSINVNQPVMSVSITLKRTSTLTVTVKNEDGLPIVAALVSIAGISGETNAEGIIVLQSVPYGTYIMTTIVN